MLFGDSATAFSKITRACLSVDKETQLMKIQIIIYCNMVSLVGSK